MLFTKQTNRYENFYLSIKKNKKEYFENFSRTIKHTSLILFQSTIKFDNDFINNFYFEKKNIYIYI
jgi:hypothetical protein